MHERIPIQSVAHGGHGVCRIEGHVCFVPYALPGDVVDVEIARQSKGVLWGRIARVVEPSPHRTKPECPVFGECGGCSWLHFAYPAQAEWKRRIVSDCLERIAKVDVEVQWAEDPSLRLGYRTRAEFQTDGAHWGFFRSGTHEVVDVVSCPLCHPRLNAALARLRALKLRNPVELVVNPEGDDILAWTKQPELALSETFSRVNSPRDTERHSFLFDGVPVANGAFSQASLLLNRVLRAVVNQMVAPKRNAGVSPAELSHADSASTPQRSASIPAGSSFAGKDAGAPEPPSRSPSPLGVLDLYCGNGNLSLGLPANADITGIDHNRAAVKAAAAIGRGLYKAADEAEFRKILRTQPWDIIILDPPRTGAKTIAADLAHADAAAIVYVSCDPATLARDVKTLATQGWRVETATAVDLFPYTPHVESVCRLGR